MKERPIIMSGPSLAAILDGKKTQTRRIVKDATGAFWDHAAYRPSVVDGVVQWSLLDGSRPNNVNYSPMPRCPYGKVGDYLWVKETFALAPVCEDPDPEIDDDWHVVYRADGDERPWRTSLDENAEEVPPPWKPSIFMPRWASRITLEVTGVRVERLHAITDDDARAEGVEPYTPPSGCISPDQRVPGPGFDDARLGDQPHRLAFADRWGDVHGDDSWAANPWVWVIEFRRNKP